MNIFGINKILGIVQIYNNGRKFSCPTKEINGELFFHFKKQWFKVADYVSEYTDVLEYINNNVILKRLK
jgi:hypothetical protein